jgi:hypothetical protein
MKLNMSMFSEKYKYEKDIKIYSNLQQLDEIHENYTNLSKEQMEDLASYIHDNYDKMDESEMKCIAMKCLDLNEIKDILLTFEFNNYKIKPKEMTLDKFAKKALLMFNRYYRICGSLLEDSQWVIHKTDSSHFEVSKHEIMFQNTVDNLDNGDGGLSDYLEKMVENLDMVAPNIDVSLEVIENKKITYVLIWARLNDVEDECVVGL